MSDTVPQLGVREEFVLVENEFARLDGILRRSRNPGSRVVVVQTHPRAASHENLAAWPHRDLPLRGVDTFAYNNRVTNSTAGTEVITVWEDLALDVAAAVAEMRRRGYAHVVLYGYSAGGPLVSYYQNVAENGNAALNGGAALSGFRGYLRNGRDLPLPAADALITQNGTTGTAFSFLTRLDGSVVDEETGARDPALDPFESANGYDRATGSAAYPADFLTRYFAAQCRRMNRLVAESQERLAACRAGGGRFTDDELITIPGIRAEPASVDLSLASRTREAWPTYPDGEAAVARSVRHVVPRYAERNRRFRDGGTVHTLSSFLSYRAVLVDPDVHDPDAVTPAETGVDLKSSNSTTPGNIAGVRAPLLITAGTADTQVHLPHAELMYNSAVLAADKRLAVIEGAEHDMTPVGERWGDTRARHLDVLVDWLAGRFPGIA